MQNIQMKHLRAVEVKSRQELRAWLEENHLQTESVWLVSYKKNEPRYYIEYSTIVDELLCFGWIDSLPRLVDERRKSLRISPRKPKSVWSKINRDKVKRLIQEGLMTPAGLAVIERAKKNGSWNALKDTDSNKLPPDLKTALEKNPKAKTNFFGFPPSTIRAILDWIAQAKRPETRLKRIQETTSLAQRGIRANQGKPK